MFLWRTAENYPLIIIQNPPYLFHCGVWNFWICTTCFFFSRTACEPGYFSEGVQEQCTICPEGEYCEFTTASGKQCPKGTYSEAGSTNCTTCEAGYFCPSTMGKYSFGLVDYISIEKWATSWQIQQNECAPNEDSDQLGRPPSLISVFPVRSMGS